MSRTRNQKRAKYRATGNEEDKMNPAGFYKGMEGVFLNKKGHRRIYEISLTPEGEIVSEIGAHPIQVSHIIAQLMTDHPMTRQFIFIAVEKYKAELNPTTRFKRVMKTILKFVTFGFFGKDAKPAQMTDEKAPKPGTEPLKKV